jgi:hypothetical protein
MAAVLKTAGLRSTALMRQSSPLLPQHIFLESTPPLLWVGLFGSNVEAATTPLAAMLLH